MFAYMGYMTVYTVGVRLRLPPKARDPLCVKESKLEARTPTLVNMKDLLVIFDPTKRISINNHLLLPINSPPWGWRWGLLAILLSHSLGLLSFSF